MVVIVFDGAIDGFVLFCYLCGGVVVTFE